MNKEDLKAIRDLLRDELKAELDPMKTQLDGLQSQVQENTQILKALEHSAEVNKAEHDKMSNNIAHMEGHLKNIDESVDVMKEVLGRHEIDITILKRRPV
ncbi:hypothetical protein ACJDU8_21635 [Clostridium sp. WILCCON 0269]|uniref:Uncharacterized protein n=1 Tax=Candidatus Clostridium eludens TaxID=3381663 RepID=A0ABW8SQ09_9CLOT